MAFLAPLVSEVGALTLRRALPWLFSAFTILMLWTATWVQTVRCQAARMVLQTATAQIETNRQDAVRWQAAANQRDIVIREQAAQLTHLRADAAQAQQVADDLDAARRRQIADLDKELK